jgi:hypothetical protein
MLDGPLPRKIRGPWSREPDLVATAFPPGATCGASSTDTVPTQPGNRIDRTVHRARVAAHSCTGVFAKLIERRDQSLNLVVATLVGELFFSNLITGGQL